MLSGCDATTDEQESMLADELERQTWALESMRWSILVDYAQTTVCEKIVSQIDATCEAVIAQ